ncbi:MAG TPA: DUF1583 domain-containing protein, partial [Planctomycetaceae bacterium]|nr:DUF1583 domain-containing protein [Planctomycetaceae bacterium]
EVRYEKIKILPVESVTHLRISRRGDVLFFLYRPTDDAPDELLGYLPASTDDIPPGGLMTMCRTGGVGKETIIKVKSMDVRAARIFEIATEP